METARVLQNFTRNHLFGPDREFFERLIELLIIDGSLPVFKPEFSERLCKPEIINIFNVGPPPEDLIIYRSKISGGQVRTTRNISATIINPTIVGLNAFIKIVGQESPEIRGQISKKYAKNMIRALLGLSMQK